MSGSAEHGGYVVMQQFMIDDFGLSGDELMVYAIIFGFCQDGRSYCRCSRSYFAYWLGKSKRSVSRILDSLVERGLIVREHEFNEGQTLPRYRLGQNAPGVAIERIEVVVQDCGSRVNGVDSPDKGGASAHPPCHGDFNDFDVSAGGRGVRWRTPLVTSAPPVTNWQADTDTDSYTDTESDREHRSERSRCVSREGATEVRQRCDKNSDKNSCGDTSEASLQREFYELKSHMPSTDGYGYAYDNFRTLRQQGFSFDEIVSAADKLTQALRADYPDRPACFLPHAERLLDLKNVQGISRFLDKKRVNKLVIPDDKKLFLFAMTSDIGDLGREAARLNEAIVQAPSSEAKEEARKALNAWFTQNRAELIAAWRSRKGA